MIYPYLAKVGAYSLKHYSVCFILLPRFSLTSFLFCFCENPGEGGGRTSLYEANNGDASLDGVAFSRLDHIGVAFSIELLEYGVAHFLIFGVRQFFIFTISKRTRMFFL